MLNNGIEKYPPFNSILPFVFFINYIIYWLSQFIYFADLMKYRGNPKITGNIDA
jgi:hypothetical protein